MKKVLSIVLSIVMVLCMMPAMAFADTATVDFTDAADIQHDVAVDTLAALGIIGGYPDGSFGPENVVTRAEMCKMICTIINGGKDPVLSTTTTSFGDTKGHWAAGYIEYCASLGIVEGVGAGQFAPNAPVTAEQAAKMLLIAQGYNAQVEGMTGAQWASNTNVLANQNGLYEELAGIVTSEGLARDNAAQMMYNVLGAVSITKSSTINSDGSTSTSYTPDYNNTTVAEKYLGLKKAAADMTKVAYDKKTAKYQYTVATSPVAVYASAADYSDLFGQCVEVLYKLDSNGTPVVYGMYADDCEVVYEGVYGDIDASTFNATKKTVKIDGVEFKTEGTTIPAVTAAYGNVATPAAIQPYSEIKVVDHEADGDIDSIVYVPVTVAKVNYVGKTQITYGSTTDDLEDVIVYDGVAKGDYVAVTTDTKTLKDELTKIEVLKDVKVTSTKGSTATIDGVAYENLGSAVAAGTKYDAVAVLNDYIVAVEGETTKADISKYAVVTGRKTVNDYATTEYAKILGADGTETEVVLATTAGFTNKNLVTFAVDDNEYTLTDAVTTTASGFDVALATPDFVAKSGDTPAKVSGAGVAYAIADDAVVFVKTTKDGKDTFSVITGAELAAKSSATITHAYGEKSETTGYTTIVMAYISAAASDTNAYAYVTDTVVKNVADGKTTYDVALSTGDFVTTSTCDASALVKGDIVAYTVNAENKISSITTAAVTTAAVQAYDGTNISFDGSTSYKFAEKATIIYIDSEAKAVMEGGSISLAGKNASDVLINNVKYLLATEDGSTVVKLLVVDVNNEMK